MRTKSITYFDAGLICTMRIDQSREGVVLPLPEFADKLLRDGYITKPVRRVTLWRILTGRYYPGLKFEGVPIDFSLMPDNVRGVSHEDQLRHGLHDVKGGFHELRHETRETVSELRGTSRGSRPTSMSSTPASPRSRSPCGRSPDERARHASARSADQPDHGQWGDHDPVDCRSGTAGGSSGRQADRPLTRRPNDLTILTVRAARKSRRPYRPIGPRILGTKKPRSPGALGCLTTRASAPPSASIRRRRTGPGRCG